MAISVDARSSGTTTMPGNVTGATSMSWTHTLGAGLSNGILMVGVAQDAGGASTSAVWDSGGTNVAMTLKTPSGVTGTVRAEIWFLKAPVTSGAKTIKVSWSGSHDGLGASASYAGVDQTTTFNAASPQTSTGTGNSSLGITTTSGEEAFNVAVKDLASAGSTPTKGASQNYVGAAVDTSTSTIEAGVSDQAATTTTTTVTWTLPASGNYVTLGVSLLPASSGTAFTQTLTETITLSDTRVNRTGKVLTESLTPSDTLIRLTVKLMTETWTPSDVVVRQTGKVCSDSVTWSDNLLRQTTKPLTETVTFSDVLSTVKVFLRTLSETLSLTDSLARSTGKVLVEQASFSDVLTTTSRFFRTLTESITFSDVVAGIIASILAAAKACETFFLGADRNLGVAVDPTTFALEADSVLESVGPDASLARPNADLSLAVGTDITLFMDVGC